MAIFKIRPDKALDTLETRLVPIFSKKQTRNEKTT